jgi:hypothetical protein
MKGGHDAHLTSTKPGAPCLSVAWWSIHDSDCSVTVFARGVLHVLPIAARIELTDFLALTQRES